MPFYPSGIIWQSCVSHFSPELPECCNCLQTPTSSVIRLFKEDSFHILSCPCPPGPAHIIHHLRYLSTPSGKEQNRALPSRCGLKRRCSSYKPGNVAAVPRHESKLWHTSTHSSTGFCLASPPAPSIHCQHWKCLCRLRTLSNPATTKQSQEIDI